MSGRDGGCLALGRTTGVPAGTSKASMVGARDQARGRPSGGSSRREARRAGRTWEEGAVRKPRRPSGPGGPSIASVAALPTWEPGEPVGSPDSPHGAAFRQGLASSSSPTEDGASEGRGAGRAGAGPWSQQQEAPRHLRALAEMGLRLGLDSPRGRDRRRVRLAAPAEEAEEQHDRGEEPAAGLEGPDVFRLELHGSGLVDDAGPYRGSQPIPQWSCRQVAMSRSRSPGGRVKRRDAEASTPALDSGARGAGRHRGARRGTDPHPPCGHPLPAGELGRMPM